MTHVRQTKTRATSLTIDSYGSSMSQAGSIACMSPSCWSAAMHGGPAYSIAEQAIFIPQGARDGGARSMLPGRQRWRRSKLGYARAGGRTTKTAAAHRTHAAVMITRLG